MTEATQAKPLSRSRTVWWQIGTVLATVGVEFAAFVDVLPEEWKPFALMLVIGCGVIGNVILRVVTSQPVTWG